MEKYWNCSVRKHSGSPHNIDSSSPCQSNIFNYETLDHLDTGKQTLTLFYIIIYLASMMVKPYSEDRAKLYPQYLIYTAQTFKLNLLNRKKLSF